MQVLKQMMVTLGDECKRYANNFYIFESNLEIQRKTMVIRYEDLALNPMKYSRKVYKFLGVKFTESIEQMMKDAIEPPKKEIKDKGISENFQHQIQFPNVFRYSDVHDKSCGE